MEAAAVALLLLPALTARVVGIDSIEPNILPDEADHLSTMYRILAGRGPGPFDLSWDGNPAFSLYPSLLAVWLLGGALGSDYAALRLASGLASVLMLLAFYAVCRRHCGPLAALGATGLLAFSPWTLFFSRNGEVNVFVALYAMLAAWSLQRALDGGSWPSWALAGFWAGMGWYGFLAGVLILPSLLAPLAWWLLTRRICRRRLLVGSLVLLSAFALTVLPRAPILLERWSDVQRYVDGRSAVRGVPAEQLPRLLASQTAITVRAFLLLDPTLDGNPRYLPPARAPLDGASGTLYVLGLVLAFARFSELALWLALLIVPLAPTQILTTGIPDLARAIVALPGFFLLVGLALQRGLGIAPRSAIARAALIVGVAWVGWTNWRAYEDWMRSPEAARHREPAIWYDEFGAWREEQQRRARDGEPGLTVTAWREEHPRVAGGGPGSRGGAAAPRNARPRPPLAIRPVLDIDAGRSLPAPRGVAVTTGGEIVVADQGGRLGRVEADGSALTPLPRSRSAPSTEAWDLAAGADGFFYVADPGRNLVVKLAGDGQVVATLGEDWGMYRPRGIDAGPDGHLYVADTGRNRVIVATVDGKLVASIGPSTPAGELDQPTDVAVDDAGRLFVAQPERGRLDVLTAAGARVGGWSIARGDTVESPRVAITEQGAIVVSEPSARHIRVFDAAGTPLGEVQTAPTAAFGLAVGGGRLYATDPARGRLLGFALEPR